jgi:transcriptional regulator with XRE-family HTH domain
MIKTIHSTQYQLLVNWLKENRQAQELTMRDLAKKLNMPHSFIGKVEQCERKLDVIEFINYCQALNLSPIEGIQLILSKS